MKFPYDTDYFPPAPSVEIQLGVPGESLSIGPLTAFVDSGADATLLPVRYLRTLPVQVDNRKRLRSQWGESRIVDIYLLDIGIGNIRLPVIEVVADNRGDEIIVGRNVLNKLRILLDGLAQVTEVKDV